MASCSYLFIFFHFGCRSDVAEQSGELVSRSMAGSMMSRCFIYLINWFAVPFVFHKHNFICVFLSISRENFGYADAHTVPRQMATAVTGPADWREALDIVALGLPEQVVLLLSF